MRNRVTSIAVRTLVLAGVIALAGCSLLGGKKTPPTQYAPMAPSTAEPGWPHVDAQLVLAPVQIARPYDSLRIAVRPTPQELQVYKDAAWAQRPSEMLANSLLRLLEDSGRLRGVGRAGSGVNGDFRLLLDVRRFESDYAGAATPKATLEVRATLLRNDAADVVATRTFVEAEPVNGTAVPQVVDAFDRALARVDRDIAGWTLTSLADAHR